MDNTYISAAELKNNPLNISSLIVLTLALVAAMPFSHLFLLHLGVVNHTLDFLWSEQKILTDSLVDGFHIYHLWVCFGAHI